MANLFIALKFVNNTICRDKTVCGRRILYCQLLAVVLTAVAHFRIGSESLYRFQRRHPGESRDPVYLTAYVKDISALPA